MVRTRPWEVSDELWERVKPLIPQAPSHAKGGRPRIEDRKAFQAIVYVLRTGIQWNALPRELAASSTAHDRFQEWERAGFFKALWQAGLSEYGISILPGDFGPKLIKIGQSRYRGANDYCCVFTRKDGDLQKQTLVVEVFTVYTRGCLLL